MTSRLTVLHVEDEADDRMILKAAFSKMAPHVDIVAACDGQEAIRLLEAARPLPHLVLLDLKLPKKSGFEVLEWTRSRSAYDQVPVMIFTSSQEESDIARAYALGATSYLVKSPDLKQMRQIVKGIGEYVQLIAERPFRVSR